MKTKYSFMIFFGIVFLIIGLMYFVYVKYEKPKQENAMIYSNLSVAVFNDEEIQSIVNVEVFRNGYFSSNITSTSHGFVLVKIPVNSTVMFVVNEKDF